ncbi:MAG: hypothetical protein RLZZ142_828 [Verrucomicrobiota bacterium]|jgi:shikimate kinase
MDPSKPQNLILVGFMGSGKSSVGRLAAKSLGFDFFDTDQLIVERIGKPITQIFAEEGEEAFREIETCVLRSLAHFNHAVISTGGGAVLRSINREMLHHAGFVVRLQASEDVLFERVSRNTKRPLLQGENPREKLRELLAVREPAYEQAADWSLDTSALSLNQAVDAILLALRHHFAWTPSP